MAVWWYAAGILFLLVLIVIIIGAPYVAPRPAVAWAASCPSTGRVPCSSHDGSTQRTQRPRSKEAAHRIGARLGACDGDQRSAPNTPCPLPTYY